MSIAFPCRLVMARWFFSGIVWLWFAGCGGGEEPPATSVQSPPSAERSSPANEQPAPARPGTPAVPRTEPAPVPAAPEASSAQGSTSGGEPQYVYRAGNRRDPFRSIVVSGEKVAGEALLHPLQQHAVGDLRLVAIVWGGFGSSAMLQTPDGKGYTVRVGATVGNHEGVVKQIQPDHIVIEEHFTNLFGEREDKTTKLDLHLPKEEAR
ncbi:MAG: pilus assembly protein PilP [Nitrospirota bacterium]